MAELLLTVIWLGRHFASLELRNIRFDIRLVHMRFVTGKVALGRILVEVRTAFGNNPQWGCCFGE
jgi:hypothetical protein